MNNYFKKYYRFIIIGILMILVLLTNNYAIANDKEIMNIASTDTSWNENSGRVYLFWKPTGSFGGITQKNYIHVYAFEGETIALGSNIYNAAYDLEGKKNTNSTHKDEDSVDIVLYDLKNKSIPIDIRQNGVGHINSLEKEKAAKSITSSKGNDIYTPYTYTVTETGVYTIEFRSFGGSGTGNYAKNKNVMWEDPNSPQDPKNIPNGVIAAWDISVFNENDQRETGRTYSEYLALQAANTVKEKYYVLTSDNYIYEVKFNGIRPYTFNFFANNRGVFDSATGNIVYKSVKDLKNENSFSKFGVSYKFPGGKETDFSKDCLIFFEEPSEDLKGYLYDTAYMPDPVTNIHFLGPSITGNQKEMIKGMGGYFSFDVEEATTATLRLDFKDINDGEYAPVEITDVVQPYSTNYFYWDGKDGNGKYLPANEYSNEQISYSVTAKAGEVHFPIIDMEDAPDGITFTRINNIYDKDGKQIDNQNTIYDKTRNVVYYDDTAIYYGEKVASTGTSEKEVENAKNYFTTDDGFGGLYCAYSNSIYTVDNNAAGENKMFNEYAKNKKIRIGDHSHTTNIIDFTKDYASQSDLINYLDSKINPVGQGLNSKGDAKTTTTDYGIANYWMFTSANPVKSNDEKLSIKENENDNLFSLSSRVFYDVDRDGVYDPQVDNDYLLTDVKLNLYKETKDIEPNKSKKYVYINDSKLVEIKDFTNIDKTKYELIEEAITPLQGSYMFENLEYDKENGTKYLYQVVRKESYYSITTSSKKPSGTETYGEYNLYGYDKSLTGKEIQAFTVGGVDPNNAQPKNNIITTIDVGYYFDVMPYSLKIKKNWNIPVDSSLKEITPTVFEISYNLNGKTNIYEMRPLADILTKVHTYDYLETKINGEPVKDYYVSAEYYIYKDKIFKHKYNYNPNTANYESFVGKDYYYSLSDYYKEQNQLNKDENYKYSMEDIPDFNNDGVHSYDDLSAIEDDKWKEALSLGASAQENQVVAPFNSVVDINVGTAITEISITNSGKPGTIEILKYTGDVEDGDYLDGATFRIYEGELEEVKKKIDNYNDSQLNLNKATSDEEKQKYQQEFEKASEEVEKIQIKSGTTRSNGRIAFSGLDSQKTYTIRERFAPSGYRILEEFYQVSPTGTKIEEGIENKSTFDENNYCLLKIGNVEAVGDLEIRKTIRGRKWIESDSFTFDISFNKENIDINIEDKAFYDESNKDTDTLINEFIEKFKDSNDITINNNNEYTILDKDERSIDTKSYIGLLKSGINENNENITKASLNNIEFPVAGTYTFTIKENESKDKTLNTSTRLYTVTIDVVRVLNNEDEQDKEVDLENSHLEASVSKITVKDTIDSNSQSSTYAGNSPTFVNNYIVENLDQNTNYIIEKNLIGRKDNQWLDTDNFTFIVDGHDENTQNALKEEKIKIEGDFKKENDGVISSEKEFNISKDTLNHQFKIEKLDFHNIEFEVDSEGDEIVTKPIIYYLDIKEKLPNSENDNLDDGISYSKDVYTLKITLENSIDNNGKVEQEKDGIIDKIILDLYKNYDFDNESKNKSVSTCTITQTKNQDGTITKKEDHDTRKDSHKLIFENKCEVKVKIEKIWEDDNNKAEKRPDSINIKLSGSTKSGEETEYSRILTNDNESEDNDNIWEYTFEHIPEYNLNGEKITYTVKEQEVQTGDLKLYKNTIGEIEEVTGEKNSYQIKITNKFEVPDEKIQVNLSKVWVDNKNESRKRPESIKLKLVQKGPSVAVDKKEYEQTLTEANIEEGHSEDSEDKWSVNIDLPKYNELGDVIQYDKEYEIQEEFTSQFYQSSIDNSNRVITNTFKVPEDKISITVKKVWEDNENEAKKRPDSLKIKVEGQDPQTGAIISESSTKEYTFENKTEDEWSYTFTGLPKYDSYGDEINYTVKEEAVEKNDLHYYDEPVITGDMNSGFTLTNKSRYKKLTVHFEGENGIEVLDDKEIEGITGETFTNEDLLARFQNEIPEYYELNQSVMPGESGTVTLGDQEQITYYYTLKNYDYTVKYVENTGSKELDDAVTKQSKYGTEIQTSNEVKSIIGYKFIRADSEKITITTDVSQNIITLYYEIDNEQTKNNNYTIEYYKDGIKQENDTIIESENVQVLEPSEITVNKDKIITEKKYLGYKFDKIKIIIPNEAEKDTTKEEISEKVVSGTIIKVYYVFDETQTKQISYTIEYYKDNEKSEEEKITETVHVLIDSVPVKKEYLDDTVIKNKFENDGYEFTKSLPETIPSEVKDGDVIQLFYQSISATIKIRYLYNVDNTELKPEEDVEGILYHTLDLSKYEKEIEGFTVIKRPEPLIVTYAKDPTTYDFIYGKNAKVVVNYIDVNNEDTPLDTEEKTGFVGDEYNTNPKAFDGYVLLNDDEHKVTNSNGKFTDDTITINYYYAHISEGLIERHVDVKTNELIEPETIHKGNEGDSYKIESKNFEGYDLVTDEENMPKNTEGKLTKELIEVNYYYIRKTQVRVEYIDINTKEEIPNIDEVDREIIDGHQGDNYKTTEKQFEGYSLLKELYPENASGIMGVFVDSESREITTQTIVKYYYAKISAGVIEKHINLKTGELLETTITHDGNEGDPYEILPKEFDGFDLVTDEAHLPKNGKGLMKSEVIEVSYYYIRKVKVITKYLERETGIELAKSEELNLYEGDSYTTNQIDVNGYTFISVDGDASGVVQADNIIVKYYYDKVKEEIKEDIVQNIDTPKKATKSDQRKPKNTTTSSILPKTGQSRYLYIALLTVIIICLGGLWKIKSDDEKNQNDINK